MTTLHICREEMREVHREDIGRRFCFYCRKHVEFMYVVTAPVRLSYYGPNPSIQCPRGHVDGDLFPGRVREWEV